MSKKTYISFISILCGFAAVFLTSAIFVKASEEIDTPPSVWPSPECSVAADCDPLACTTSADFCPTNVCEDGVCVVHISEYVECIFNNATSKETCYSNYGGCSVNPSEDCESTISSTCAYPQESSCKFKVTGKVGEKLTWQSTCGIKTISLPTTTIDGDAENIEFNCSVCGNGICEVGEATECTTYSDGSQSCAIGTCPKDCEESTCVEKDNSCCIDGVCSAGGVCSDGSSPNFAGCDSSCKPILECEIWDECVPNETRCSDDNNYLQKCDETGEWYTFKACSCQNGLCIPSICEVEWTGWVYENGACTKMVGTGCENPFKYSSQKDCEEDNPVSCTTKTWTGWVYDSSADECVFESKLYSSCQDPFQFHTKAQCDAARPVVDCAIPICKNGSTASKTGKYDSAGCPIYNDCEITTVTPKAGYEDEVITNPNKSDNPFSDVDVEDTEGKAAVELYRRGVIGGFADGEFKGTRPVNRAEAAKFLLLARGTEVGDLSNNEKFWDVKDGEWYVPFVMRAAQRAIIGGYSDGSFRPEDTVNTAEFLKMLTKTFGLAPNLKYSYSDVDSDAWYAQFAGIAQKYDLFPNRGNRLLLPARDLTRDEVAVAIYQFLKNR